MPQRQGKCIVFGLCAMADTLDSTCLARLRAFLSQLLTLTLSVAVSLLPVTRSRIFRDRQIASR
jgi:hypothetical protein